MKAECTLEFIFDSESQAVAIAGSLKVDDENFVQTKVDGNKITAIIKADSIPSLIHTTDDYMACMSIAERSVREDLK